MESENPKMATSNNVLIWWWCGSQPIQLHIGNFDFGFSVKHKRKYIIHQDFVFALGWSYDKRDEARLLVEHSNMLSLGWHVITLVAPSWWNVNLGTTYLNVPLAAVHHLCSVISSLVCVAVLHWYFCSLQLKKPFSLVSYSSTVTRQRADHYYKV